MNFPEIKLSRRVIDDMYDVIYTACADVKFRISLQNDYNTFSIGLTETGHLSLKPPLLFLEGKDSYSYLYESSRSDKQRCLQESFGQKLDIRRLANL